MLFKILVGLLVALYAVVFWKTVDRFFQKVVRLSEWYRVFTHQLVRRWEGTPLYAPGVLIALVILIPVFASLYLAAPFLGFYLYHLHLLDKKEKERREKVQQELREEAERRRVESLAENNRRAEARKKWLSENKPKLYSNTIDGITAVLLPKDYEEVVKQTAINRRNGFWERENVLCLAPNTIVFVTKQGQETILKSSRSGDFYYKIAGLLSQLDEIVEAGSVELVKDERIFVPWVNETLVPFSEQKKMLLDCQKKGTFEKLVEAQAPADIRPL